MQKREEKREDIMAESVYEPILIPMEDDLVHTDDHPFCYDATCDCHEDPVLIAEVTQAVADDLLTPQEASDFVASKLI